MMILKNLLSLRSVRGLSVTVCLFSVPQLKAQTSRPATQAVVLDPAVALPDVIDRTKFAPGKRDLPTCFLCGDSTMDCRSNPREPLIDGFRARIGWGGSVIPHFDTARINIEDHAKGGASSRSFMMDGYWGSILARLKSGDFVVIEFGHNDSTSLGGVAGRGSLKENGPQTQLIINGSGNQEVVHTFGWYLKKFVTDTRAHGATPILLSPVPRNYWKSETQFNNVMSDYTRLTSETAVQLHVQYIDMNQALAQQYSPMGQARVTSSFFTSLDKTHTSPSGAKNAARVFATELAKTKCPLKDFLLKNPDIPKISPTGVED